MYISTMCDDRRSGSALTGDVYLRRDMYGNEGEKVLWSEWQFVLYATG